MTPAQRTAAAQRIGQIRTRLEQRTPGQWHQNERQVWTVGEQSVTLVADADRDDDAELMANAPDDLVALLRVAQAALAFTVAAQESGGHGPERVGALLDAVAALGGAP